MRRLDTAMAFPKQFLKLSFLFSIDDTVEIAETSLNISTVGTSPYDAAAALTALTSGDADSISGQLVGTINGPNLLWANYSTYVALKAAAIGTDGHYLTDPVLYPFPGHTGTHDGVPPQDTVVLTLKTGSTFGKANFGRMYLPHTMAPLESATPRIAASRMPFIVADMATMIRNINTVMDGEVAASGVVILSQIGAGTVKAPVSVAVGRVIDTQRRRRNRLAEDPVSELL
jgi:hypothetical protein